MYTDQSILPKEGCAGDRVNLKKGVSRKQSTPNFPKNKHFLPPDTHTYLCVSGGKKCSFFGKFDVLCLLKTPVLRFALLLYYRRSIAICHGIVFMEWLSPAYTTQYLGKGSDPIFSSGLPEMPQKVLWRQRSNEVLSCH